MNTACLLRCAPALVAALVLPSCGSGTISGSSSAIGSSSEGGTQNAAGGGNSSGATSSGAGAPTGGAANDGGAGGGLADDAAGTTSDAEGTSTAEAGAMSDSGSGDASGGPVTPDTKVVMYLPNWSGSFSSWANRIDYSKMTHLLLAFGTVNSGTNDWNMGAADSDVKALAAAAHAKNVKVLVSVGGADADIGIINRYQTQSNIAPLVANLDAFVTRLDLDGVDVDLERGADMKSSGNYPEFIKTLVSTFRPEGKFVTTALAQYIVQDAGADAALNAVIGSFDFINLMIYSTNMSTYTNELNWWTTHTGIAKTKLTWGIQFTNQLSVATAKQLTTASKAYGGVMVWEYSQGSEPQLWPAVQSAL